MVTFPELPHYRTLIEQDNQNVLNQLILEKTSEMIKVEADLMTDFFSVLDVPIEPFVKEIDAKEKK